MHELALCEAIARAVSEHAHDQPVESVQVRIGHLRQVVPDALTFSWDVLTAGTSLDGCVLEIEHVPATVSCATCGVVTTLRDPLLVCGSCAGFDVTLLTGEEFTVQSYQRI